MRDNQSINLKSQVIALLMIILCLVLGASDSWAYESLADTGFYELKENIEDNPYSHNEWHQKRRWRARGLFAPYSPQYPLWSDGTDKRRWIYIPKHKKIDTSDPDNWVFPVGTKIWKEFAFQENGKKRKIETRLMEKLESEQWLMETYVWNEAQTEATLAPYDGIKNYYALGNGKYYDIPGHHDCQYCHEKAGLSFGPQKTAVLGFSALQLSGDRDPNAIHGEPHQEGMLNLPRLENLRITTTKLGYDPTIPESEDSPLQRRVFGYLHGNCGHCHHPAGMGEFTNTLDLSHGASDQFIQQNGVYRTAIGKSITYYLAPPNSPEKYIEPGDSSNSAIVYRMTNEVDEYTFLVPDWHHMAGFSLPISVKMPFAGTNVIDQEAVDAITDYINNLPN